MKKATFLAVILISTFLLVNVYAQKQASVFPESYKRNVVKWNMTPFFLWGSSNLNFSYERVLKPHQSFSLNAGYFVLPISGIYNGIKMKTARKKSGFTFSGDYRFYFKNRNTKFAPDGLFWAPYGSFHHYQFSNSIEPINNPNIQGSLSLDAGFNILSMGVELGYQFVIKERLTVDLIFMGPSLSLYSAKFDLGGDLTVDEENEYLEAIRDILVGKFPFLDDWIEYKNFDTNGATTSMGFGLRYLIQVGYRF